MLRTTSGCLAVAVTLSLTTPSAADTLGTTLGGDEGELDVNSHFGWEFGDIEPTEREETFQTADIKSMTWGAGYTVGDVGPLEDFYFRLEGTYFAATDEAVENEEDVLPVGHRFFGADRGGLVTAILATNFVHEPRFSFGVWLQGTVPIDVDLQKFAEPDFHYGGGGTAVQVFLTDPEKLFRLAWAGRLFFGSGAYDGDFQQNAAVAMTNLFYLEASRWLLPWRIGVGVGPYFEGDLDEHVNAVYYASYASVDPDLVAGDRVRAMRLDIAVLPYFRVTDRTTVEIGYVHRLFGYDARSTRMLTAGVRGSFELIEVD
jgi:hypothetical protein